MTLIQLILLVLIAAIGAVCLSTLRRQGASRLAVLALLGLGLACVLNPDLTNRAAHFVGVGRGTDLVMYLGTLGGAYIGLLLYARIRSLDRKITELNRAIAIGSAAPSMPERASGR